jgi:hypothetical protein
VCLDLEKGRSASLFHFESVRGCPPLQINGIVKKSLAS